MSDVADLTQRLQAKILSQYPSTVSVVDDVTIISTSFEGFDVSTQIREYDQSELDDALKLAGVVGAWSFTSQLGAFYEESMETYRSLLDTFCDTTVGQVWAKREGCPDGYIRIGMSTGIQITHSQNGVSDEALMSAFYAFANDTHALAEFAGANLKVLLDEA
jgi:hypothetical protein